MTSNYYCIADVRLLIDGEWYLSNDGWFKFTDILLANGEKYYPNHNSSISEIKYEFEFTAVKEGEEVMRDELYRIFRGLNKNMVPTKILLDRAINYADIKRYDGTCLAESTIVNRHILKDVEFIIPIYKFIIHT